MAAPRALAKKPNVIRSAIAYSPALPAHLANAPSFHRPRAPAVLPFFKEQSHRIPTKWSCYRPLLRATSGLQQQAAVEGETADDTAGPSTSKQVPSPSSTSRSVDYPNIRRHIKERWKKKRVLLAEKPTRHFLEQQYTLLSLLTSTSSADRAAMSSLESYLCKKHGRYDRKESARKQAAEEAKAKRVPRLVGGYIYPTAFNPPIPRLKPQPVHISMMIKRRVLSREARLAKMRMYRAWISDMKLEVSFWSRCGLQGERLHDGRWDEETRNMLASMSRTFMREKERENMKFSEEDVDRVEEARKRRRAWMAEHRPKFKAEKRKMWAEQAERHKANVQRKKANKAESKRKLEEAKVRRQDKAADKEEEGQ